MERFDIYIEGNQFIIVFEDDGQEIEYIIEKKEALKIANFIYNHIDKFTICPN